MAVQHLAAHGHHRSAFLGDPRNSWTAAKRHQGYVAGLALAGLRLDPTLVWQDLADNTTAAQASIALLNANKPPMALVCEQNLITIGAIRMLRQRSCQHHIALPGFDDLLLVDMFDPPILVVAQNLTARRHSAAERLFARLTGRTGPLVWSHAA